MNKVLVCIPEEGLRVRVVQVVRSQELEPVEVATHVEAIEALTREPFRFMVNQLGRPPSVPDPLNLDQLYEAPLTAEEEQVTAFIKESKQIRPEMKIFTLHASGRRHVSIKAGAHYYMCCDAKFSARYLMEELLDATLIRITKETTDSEP